jgi:hypothetical protein
MSRNSHLQEIPEPPKPRSYFALGLTYVLIVYFCVSAYQTWPVTTVSITHHESVEIIPPVNVVTLGEQTGNITIVHSGPIVEEIASSDAVITNPLLPVLEDSPLDSFVEVPVIVETVPEVQVVMENVEPKIIRKIIPTRLFFIILFSAITLSSIAYTAYFYISPEYTAVVSSFFQEAITKATEFFVNVKASAPAFFDQFVADASDFFQKFSQEVKEGFAFVVTVVSNYDFVGLGNGIASLALEVFEEAKTIIFVNIPGLYNFFFVRSPGVATLPVDF